MCNSVMEVFSGNVSFTRPMHEWEVDLVSSFFELLYSDRLWQRRIKYVRSPLKGRSLKSGILSCVVHPTGSVVPHFPRRVFGELRLL
jgi:hypothetical protein